MTKRVPITSAPDAVSVLHPAGHFARACEVYLPQAPQVFTYGLADGSSARRGSVVWVQLGRGAKEDAESQQELRFSRKKPVRKGVALGLVAKVCDFPPDFPLKEAFPHASGYVFPERYMEALEWTARYYLSTPNRTLNTFWPRDLSKFLDHYAFRKADPSAETPAVLAAREQPPLTGEQSEALSKLVPLLQTAGFRGALLHGVTGSGKTRVYLELARRALALGKRVLVLVPEIGLTPQLSARFSEFLGMDVPVLHSALPEARKRETWLSILAGGARIVLGTRSAILTPYPFDVVILDEEHDGSYKQQDSSPR
ncbi:MAG: DEAD/DEAH box helicase family protein, partial [Fibrobacteraceae bacterium]